MKNPLLFAHRAAALALAVSLTASAQADPLLSSWFTGNSSKYARIYTTDTNKLNGVSVTTWTNGTQTQSLPVYCGVQELSYSASWVYIKTSGLAGHIMGPWQNGAFPNLPKNQNVIYRFPRSPGTVPTTKTLTSLGAIGYFVDGVAMFDSRDGFVWTGSAESGNGTGYWNRDAYVNEGATFDPGKAHQEQTGTHHYHANPIALRYILGDHVTYDSVNKTYSESTGAVTAHSPILGWVRDGYPVYGPYGYSSAMNASSAVTRMRTGYVLRDGTNGTDDLTSTGRTTIPAWAQRVYNVSASQSGPAVSTTYPLNRYMEDKAYLGDLGQTQGAGFDLDEYNGRFCVTPEFPGGTYAYFVSIDSSGTPTYPYNIGRAYYGTPSGASTTISETVTTYVSAGPNTPEQPEIASVNATSGDVALVWTSTEGGTYKVEAVGDLTATWGTLNGSLPAATNAVETQVVETDAATSNTQRFYRLSRIGLAAYDGGGGTGVPTAATSAATNVSTTGATLNGTVTANGLSTTTSFEYGPTTSYGSTATATPATVTGTTATGVSAAITGLTASATYHYRVKAVNSAGTTYGSDVSFIATSGSGASTAPGGSATRGTSVTVTITISAPPTLPPLLDAQSQTLLPSGVTIADGNVGTISGTGITRPAQNTVIATFAIPSGAAAGAHTITVTFPPPQGQSQGPSYSAAFTFN